MNETQKAAQGALDRYVDEARQGDESSAQAESRLIKNADAGYGALYSVGYGSGATINKAKQAAALGVALAERVKKFRRDDESFEQALARCAKEDVVTRALYAVAH